MTRIFGPASALCWVAVTCACGEGTSNNSGLEATLRIPGAQFVPESMPEPSGGPAVVSLEVTRNQVAVGTIGFPVRGALEPEATAVLVGLVGDRGHFVLSAGAADVANPGFPTYSARADIAPDAAKGDHLLAVQAVDERGRPGAAMTRPLAFVSADPPQGALVFSLSWDTNADIDLHVLDPTGAEIFARDINSADPPLPGSPAMGADGGVLDFDSNSQCVIDGRRRENVVWRSAPPPGVYHVRVDTFSLCGEPAARWIVEAFADGEIIGRAAGTSTEADTRFPHDRGAGLLALELELP